MPRVLKLSDNKIETLFDAKDFEYLIDKSTWGTKQFSTFEN